MDEHASGLRRQPHCASLNAWRAPILRYRFQGVMKLSEVLVAQLSPDEASAVSDAPALEETLLSGIAAAEAAFPGILLPHEAFARHVGSVLTGAADIARALSSLHWGELWLTLACARGDERALALFERNYMRALPRAVAHLRRDEAFAAEVQQRVREKLLVAAPAELPKIGTYSGRGTLSSWLRVGAVRAGLTLLEHEKSGALGKAVGNAGAGAASDPLVAVARAHDYEIDHLKQQFGPAFKRAFSDALASLSQDDRTILRLHLLEGLNIDQIGALKQVHRATVARWIAGAREALFDRTRKGVLGTTQLTASEFQSLGELLRSQMDVSVLRILQEDSPLKSPGS